MQGNARNKENKLQIYTSSSSSRITEIKYNENVGKLVDFD